MAVLQTYQVTTNAQDLSEFITNITPDDTPLLSSLQNTKAYQTLHEVQQDSLNVPTANDNAWIEGADFQTEDQNVPGKIPTYPQIFRKHPHVSETQLAVRTEGIKDLYSYQVTKKLKEIALDIEYAAINGTGNSGASGTAREMKGILAWITTNHLSGTGTGGQALTEGMFNDLLEDLWQNGGKRKRDCYCTGSLKRQISGFTASNTKNVAAGDKKVIAAVDVYEADFGMIKLFPHMYLPSNTLMVLNPDNWAFAWLRKTMHKPLAQTGDAVRGKITAEVALESRQEADSGKYTNVIKG